jgi:hypothetical protein
MPGGIAVTGTVDPEACMTVTTGNGPHTYS